MRVLHTSDWHFGHTLHGLSRDAEHTAFLDWLLGVLTAEEIDLLLVTGDVFETANPPATAMKLFYSFLARARKALPKLEVVIVGGNHDSAARLDAAGPVLEALGIQMIGGLPRRDDGSLDAERCVVPIHGRGGQVEAWLVAIPYLRVVDLPIVSSEGDDDEDPLIAGVRHIYTEAFAVARQRRKPGQAILATGHCLMRDGQVSEWSERKVLGGNLHGLPVELFPPEVAYVALGHLHLAQKVGKHEHIRYSGAPMAFAMDEADYPHSVVLVDLLGGALDRVSTKRVPSSVPLLRIPSDEPRPWEEVAPLLEALPPSLSGPAPYLEVRVLLPQPDAAIRRKVEEALHGKHARLVRLSVSSEGGKRALGDVHGSRTLGELHPERVFRELIRQRHNSEPSDALLEAFHHLLSSAEEAS